MSGMPVRPLHPSLQGSAFVPMGPAEAASFDGLIDRALAEDIGGADVTTEAVVDRRLVWRGRLVARERGVIAGLPIACHVFERVEPAVSVDVRAADGARVSRGETLAAVSGPAHALLTAERVALNLLARLSGIATLTRAYVDAVGEARARITDTRKTTPGLRALERYAVRAGGGVNHRFDLESAVLIKDNHLVAAGSIAVAVEAARRRAAAGTIVEVECDTIDQVRQALAVGADAILLDNMTPAVMREAVALCHGKAVLEASGGMSLARVAEVAATGVDVISVGALTHSAPALDVALDFDQTTDGEEHDG